MAPGKRRAFRRGVCLPTSSSPPGASRAGYAGPVGLAAVLALALFAGDAAEAANGFGQPPPPAPPAYHIAITPSGLPYVVQPGYGAGPYAGQMIWPYQDPGAQPPAYTGQALPAAPQAPSVPMARPEPAVPPPAAPPPRPAVRDVAPAPAPRAEPVRQEAAAPPQYEDGIYILDTDYALSWPQNVYRFFTSPLRFDETDWLITAGVAAGAGALILADKVLIDFWQDDVRGSFTDDAADVFRPLGEFDNLLYGTLGAYGIAEVLDSTGAVDARREKAAALMAAESMVLTAVLTQGAKYMFGRKRPADTDDRFDFNGPSDFDTNDAFWSGHASEVFAVASVISEVYADDNPWVPYVAYTLAGGTALSRVNDDRHWFSDIAVGAAAGYFIGKLVTNFNPFLEKQGIGVLPMVQEGGQGLNFTYNF